MMNWNQIVLTGAQGGQGHRALQSLIEQRSAVIVLRGLIGPEVLESARQAVLRNRDQLVVTEYVNGRLVTIGPYLVKYLHRLDAYFAAAHMTDQLFQDPTGDLRRIVRERLAQVLGLRRLEVAAEPDGRLYAPAVIRVHRDGQANPLHNDNIMRDAASAPISLRSLRQQLSCIVCLQECDEGGELVHYQRPWGQADEQYKIASGLGYRPQVVSGSARMSYKPQSGDVYLINSTLYHEINEVRGCDRITMGFFVGLFDDRLESAVAWS